MAFTLLVSVALMCVFLAVGDDAFAARLRSAGVPADYHRMGRGTTISEWASNTSLACGRWPPLEVVQQLGATEPTKRSNVLGWQCAGYTKRVEMPTSKGEYSPLSVCRAWCEQLAKPEGAVAGQWCCSWQVTNRGTECAWANGIAVAGEHKCQKRIRDSSVGCAVPLAFDLCSGSRGFFPVGLPCDIDRHVSGKDKLAVSMDDCSAKCLAKETCMGYAFNERVAAWNAAHADTRRKESSCRLLTKCQPSKSKTEEDEAGWRIYDRYVTATTPKMAPTQLDLPRSGPFTCTKGQMQDAMVMDGDGPGLCSQVCLPEALFDAARMRLNAVRGTCAESRCTRFVAARKLLTIPYNVYSCDLLPAEDPAEEAADEGGELKEKTTEALASES